MEPIDVKGTRITPYDLALKLWERIPQSRVRSQSSGLKVIVKGTRGGNKATYTADMVAEWRRDRISPPLLRL